LECDACGRRFRAKGGLRRHWLRRHLDGATHRCRVCALPFATYSSMRWHVSVAHEPAKFACAFCAHTFKRAEMRAVHERRHTGERPFVCATCGRRFISNATLRYHAKTHDAPHHAFTCEVSSCSNSHQNLLNIKEKNVAFLTQCTIRKNPLSILNFLQFSIDILTILC
jgi:Zinc finger, C2H2 type/C2H2-type zinc finger